MIYFRHVWAGEKKGRTPRYLLRDVCCDFIAGRHTGILCVDPALWECFFQLLGGMIFPESGEIARAGSVSWPIGWQAVFHPKLTVRENLHFFARLYGIAPRALCDFTMNFTDEGRHLDERFSLCDGHAKAKIAFAVPFGLPFDLYVGTQQMVAGPRAFHAQCNALADHMLARRTFVIQANHPNHLKRAGDHLLALKEGELLRVDSFDDLQAVHKTMS